MAIFTSLTMPSNPHGSRISPSVMTAQETPVADWLRGMELWLFGVADGTTLVVQIKHQPGEGKVAESGKAVKGHDVIMSEPFRPYEKLVDITILGRKFQVPERNSLLRCFQFISPETIPYGRFCWNQDCQYCRVTCQLPDDDEPREMLSCKFIVMPGMEITDMSQELKWCLRGKLPAEARAAK